jgi:hypothetical protein
LPIFPDGVSSITEDLAFQREEGQVVYFHGLMAVGLLRHNAEYALPPGFYGLSSVMVLLALMALARRTIGRGSGERLAWSDEDARAHVTSNFLG